MLNNRLCACAHLNYFKSIMANNKTTKYSYFIKSKKTGEWESFTGLFETLPKAYLWRDTHGEWFVQNRNHEFQLNEHLVLKTAIEPTNELIPA